jgi:EAL domain-containing protein (putative c-di-GMP-specific phosphodiesterase class I)
MKPTQPSGALPQERYREISCAQCRSGADLAFEFSFAFQPVVDAVAKRVVAYEALVRGPAGEPALSILSQVDEDNRYAFDQACRVKAIALASRLGLGCRLNINFFPNAIYRPELCIRTTLEAARQHQFPIENITFEFLESERAQDHEHLGSVVESYRKLGFKTAIDDFGTGHSGLGMLADFQPDILKIDRQLLRDVDASRPRQAIIAGIIRIAADLGIKVVAEGVETRREYAWLLGAGVAEFQGYYFARPAFEELPLVSMDRFDPAGE